jgi:predicted permease
MTNLLMEVRFACRGLKKSPVFAIVAVLVLALGIAANTAIFSIVDAVLLRKFPYKNPERLVMVWERNPALGSLVGDRIPTAPRNFEEWSKQSTAFESIAGFEDAAFNRTGGDQPEQITGARASANFFTLFGVVPSLGIGFDEASTPGKEHVAVLSDSYFQSHFGGKPSALGQTLTLNDSIYTIVGVLPPDFYLPASREGSEQRKPELWIPYEPYSTRTAVDLNRRKMQVFGRLRAGVTLDEARAEMDVLAKRLEQQNATLNSGFGINIFSIYTEDVGRNLRRNLLVLLAAVLLVLLIACANLANLMLSRALARNRELAIRRALGATRARIIRQVLAESLVLSVSGTVAGLVLSLVGIKLLLALKPAEITRPEQIHVGFAVLVFTATLTILSAVCVGLISALQVARKDVNTALQQGSGGKIAGGPQRLRGTLIVAEVALAVVLLIGAAFMMRSLLSVMNVDPGFRPDHLLTMRLNLPASHYANNERIAQFCREAVEKISALPMVKSASFSDGLPMTRIRMMRFMIEEQQVPKPGSEPTADVRGITSPRYFDTLGLTLLQGRNFTADEIEHDQPVVIINRSLARKLWPREDPVGKRIRSTTQQTGGEPAWLTIIGVIPDTKQISLESGTRPEITRPMMDYTNLTLAIRTASDPAAVTSAVERQIWELDKNLPVFQIAAMQEIVDESIAQRRFNSFLMISFAMVALVLAAVGIYGVLSALVSQRTPEIGVRMALGAQPSDVLRIILGQGIWLSIIGMCIGLLIGIALTRVLSNLLFGVGPANWTLYLDVLAGMLVIATFACYLPASRAMQVDPMIALRSE